MKNGTEINGSKEEVASSLGSVYTGEKTVAGNVGFEKNKAVLLKSRVS